jgi:hypothetical protein
MDDGFKQEFLEKLKALEERLEVIQTSHGRLREAYARSRASFSTIVVAPADVDA